MLRAHRDTLCFRLDTVVHSSSSLFETSIRVPSKWVLVAELGLIVDSRSSTRTRRSGVSEAVVKSSEAAIQIAATRHLDLGRERGVFWGGWERVICP